MLIDAVFALMLAISLQNGTLFVFRTIPKDHEVTLLDNIIFLVLIDTMLGHRIFHYNYL